MSSPAAMLLDTLVQIVRMLLQSTIGGALPKPTRFVVITDGRTGSNLLVSLLNSHPRVHAGIEVIGQWRLRNPILKRRILRLGAAETVRQYLRGAWRESAAGIKILYYQLEADYAKKWGIADLPELVNYLQTEPDIKIIHLKRRNRLHRLVSWHIAAKTQEYRRTNPAAPPAEVTLSLSPAECEQSFTSVGEREAFYDGMFRHRAKLEVYYENLVADQAGECGRILDFLGVPKRTLKTRLLKQRSRPLAEVLENYDELKSHFQGTEWAGFFDE